MANLKLCPFHDCLTCGCYDTLEIPDKEWQKRPREEALLKQLKHAKAMIERLIEAGNYVTEDLFASNDDAMYPGVDEWNALVNECNALGAG